LDTFLHLLNTTNGAKSWRRFKATLVAVGDASDSALAAFFPNNPDLVPIHLPLTPAQREAVHTYKLSSTERELMALQAVVDHILATHPHLLHHGGLQYYTDSQAEMHGVLGMKGNNATFPWVKAIRMRLAAVDARLSVIWHPRTDAWAELADYLSKLTDNTMWVLDQDMFNTITSHPVLQGRTVTLDVAADFITTKVPGAFYSQYWCPGTLGVDMLAHPWARNSQGERHLIWCNAPFDLMGPILRKILDEQVDVILLAPCWPKAWRPLLKLLPIVAQLDLPRRPNLSTPGQLVAPDQRAAASRTPHFTTTAYYIIWP
jgi:hypothetical protein